MSNNKQSDVSRIIERLKREAEETGSKRISECERPKTDFTKLVPTLNEVTSEETIAIMQRLSIREDADKRQAEVELSFINAAITLAEGSNDIGAEVTIAGITVGVSVNARLIPVLQAEAEEIRKYLRGESNNYE